MRNIFKPFFLICALALSQFCFGQLQKDKVETHITIGTFPTSLLVPKFNPIHPGVALGADYSYNGPKTSGFIQSVDLGFFYHANIQKAIQLNTEMGYLIHLQNKLRINPLTIGGGYVLSISDLNDVLFNEDTKRYEKVNSVRHNWQIQLGAGIGIDDLFAVMNRNVSVDLQYRIQVQGTVVNETVPMIAYAPVKIKLTLPLIPSSHE